MQSVPDRSYARLSLKEAPRLDVWGDARGWLFGGKRRQWS